MRVCESTKTTRVSLTKPESINAVRAAHTRNEEVAAEVRRGESRNLKHL
jgi:hypothetical protein